MSFLNLIGQNYTLRLVSHLIATGISKDESDDDQLLYLPYINPTASLQKPGYPRQSGGCTRLKETTLYPLCTFTETGAFLNFLHTFNVFL